MEDLIIISNYKKYEKKEIELYDPFQEIDEKLNGDLVDEDEFLGFEDELEEDEEGFNTYNNTTVNFSNKRINQKYYQLANRYRKKIDREEIFGFCLDIINYQFIPKLKKDYILVTEKKTLKNGKLGYHDDITTINMMLDTRINRKINKWLGTKKKVEDGETSHHSLPFFESIEGLNTSNNKRDESESEKTISDVITYNSSIYSSALSDYTSEEIDVRLNKIYEKAKLTDREIEVLQTLERTQNNNKGETYTKQIAGEMLDCSRQNVSKIFNNAKKKIMKIYKLDKTRYNLLEEIQDFLSIVEDEKQVIDFVLDNLIKEYINYILYDSDLNSTLVQYFNNNNQNESTYYTDLMREFCTYFLKELYIYEEMTEHNIKMQEIPKKPPVPVEKWEYKNIDTNIYTYIIESKLKDHEKKGKFILIDNEKYYYVKSNKQAQQKKTKEKYIKLTYLK